MLDPVSFDVADSHRAAQNAARCSAVTGRESWPPDGKLAGGLLFALPKHSSVTFSSGDGDHIHPIRLLYDSQRGGELMDEAFVLACKKPVILGGAVGFSAIEMLDLLLNETTVDQLLDMLQKRLTEMTTAQWVI